MRTLCFLAPLALLIIISCIDAKPQGSGCPTNRKQICNVNSDCCTNICSGGFCQPIPGEQTYTCANIRCRGGYECKMIQVQCFRDPCPPIPECVPKN